MKSQEFLGILKDEVAARRLVEKDVRHCLKTAYHQVSKIGHGNTGFLTLHHGNLSENQIAALVIVLRIQADWPDAIRWKEVRKQAGSKK